MFRSLCIPNYSKLCLQVLHMKICTMATFTHHGNFYSSCVSFSVMGTFYNFMCILLTLHSNLCSTNQLAEHKFVFI